MSITGAEVPSRTSASSKSFLLDSVNSQQLQGHWRDYFPEIVGRSPAILGALETVAKAARTHCAVLILGESGTGKELIASALHRLSPRSSSKLIDLNCSAIPEELLEAELFGYEKGAFTGADRRRAGIFESAHGGTLFLDEIGDMPQRLQVKLLRVLQEKKFTPIGSQQPKICDVRIIAATNVDLEKAVKNKNFRLDLYYRLNVFPVTLPPLRERGDDIIALLDHFLEKANRLHGLSQPCVFSQKTTELLLKYSWPGNVRQMQNLVERLVVLKGGGVIDTDQLPSEIFNQPRDESNSSPSQIIRPSYLETNINMSEGMNLPQEGLNLPRFIEDLENTLILQALERTHNNKNRAAKLLGLNRTTLVERIKKRKIASLNAPSREI